MINIRELKYDVKLEDIRKEYKLLIRLDPDNGVVCLTVERHGISKISFFARLHDPFNMAGFLRVLEERYGIKIKTINAVISQNQTSKDGIAVIGKFISKSMEYTISERVYFDMSDTFNDNLYQAIRRLRETPIFTLTRYIDGDVRWAINLSLDSPCVLRVIVSKYNDDNVGDVVFQSHITFDRAIGSIAVDEERQLIRNNYKVFVYHSSFDISETIAKTFEEIFNQVQWES